MGKEFIPYIEALELKELGFDEPCFAFFNGTHLSFSRFDTLGKLLDIGKCLEAPLYQQAFRWFRENYGLHPYIITLRGEWIVIGIIKCSNAEKITGSFDINFSSLEEAELACIKKLIEIVKEK
jgi:hypothetical protein